jgi:AAA+ ATPase superfamily predicted ATPase
MRTIGFLDRIEESRGLKRFLERGSGGLAVVYGRRRCGKSTLLQRLLTGPHVYFQADQRERVLQVKALAGAIATQLPNFDRASYGGWDDLLASLYARATESLCLCLDEFPYLAQADPSLPSVLQRYVDRPDGRLAWILCGSSQRMMQGLTLDRNAPLYGRAREIVKLAPLAPGWIMEALGCDAEDGVRAYAVWGGVPRYWELAAEYQGMDEALHDLVWNRLGVLHEEPSRLLLDDLRSAVQPYSILSLIGTGANRPSEIAARMGKPLSGLARPLAQLCELGYVRREVPFGEHPRKTRRALYRLNDPFLMWFFRFALPYESALAQGATAEAAQVWQTTRSQHYASCWETLCRLAVPRLSCANMRWGEASSWWSDSQLQTEVDLVAKSLDGSAILLGECKWAENDRTFDVDAMDRRLREQAARIPAARGRRIVTSCWLGGHAKASGQTVPCLTADHVMAVLK